MAGNAFAPEHKPEYLGLLSKEEMEEIEASYNYCVEYLKSFKTFNAFDFGKVLTMCDDLLTLDWIEEIPSLNQNGQNAYDNLYSILVTALNRDFNGKKIGEILITKAIEDGKVLKASELLYDCDKRYQNLGLKNMARFGVTKINGLLDPIPAAANYETKDILINTYDRYNRSMIGKDPNKARIVNLKFLLAIRHEFQHILRGLKYDDPSYNETLENKLLLFEMEIHQKLEAARTYGLFHDLFPSEYEADMVSYTTVISDLQNDYKTEYSDALCDLVSEMEAKRKQNYKPQSLETIIDYGLSNVDLPENERYYLLTKLEELQALMLKESAPDEADTMGK